MGRKPLLAILLWGGDISAQVSLSPDQLAQMATKSGGGRCGKTAGAGVADGHESASVEAVRNYQGECGHDSTTEGNCLSHGCPPGAIKRLLRRRSAIEPVIGHTKQDHALKRNYLQGTTGDRINAFLAGCGFNLRKLFRFFLTAPLTQCQALA